MSSALGGPRRGTPRGAGTRALAIGLALFAIVAVASIAAPAIAPADPNHESFSGLGPDGGPLGPGSGDYLLGSDAKGRDVLSRLLYGGRMTFAVSVIAIAVATAVGLAIGLGAAASSGALGQLLMRATDIGLAIPGLLLAAAIAAVLGSGAASVTIALAAVFWAPLARVTYGQAVVVKERPFVEAARTLGASTSRVMLGEVAPHVVPIVAAYAALCVGWAALFESSLGFLGVGVQEPTASIGSMLGQGLSWYRLHPGLVLFPALYLGVFVIGTTLIGEGLRAPRRRRAAAARRTPEQLGVIR